MITSYFSGKGKVRKPSFTIKTDRVIILQGIFKTSHKKLLTVILTAAAVLNFSACVDTQSAVPPPPAVLESSSSSVEVKASSPQVVASKKTDYSQVGENEYLYHFNPAFYENSPVITNLDELYKYFLPYIEKEQADIYVILDKNFGRPSHTELQMFSGNIASVSNTSLRNDVLYAISNSVFEASYRPQWIDGQFYSHYRFSYRTRPGVKIARAYADSDTSKLTQDELLTYNKAVEFINTALVNVTDPIEKERIIHDYI